MKFISRYRANAGFSCEDCGDYVLKNSAYYVLTNRADETVKCCPDCAGIRMAETLDAVNKTEFSNVADY